MNKLIYISAFSLVLILSGCENKCQKVIRNTNALLQFSENKSISSSLSRNFHMLETFNEHGLINLYLFERYGDNDNFFFVLSRDSIQFCPDNVIGIIPDGTEYYENKICDYFKSASEFIKTHNIVWISTEGNRVDPNFVMTVGLNNGKVLDYRPGYTGDMSYYIELANDWYLRKSN